MADARRLPVLNLIAPILAKNKPYTGQEPSDNYLDRLIQSISFAQRHMTVLENANAGDFDDAVKYDIYKAPSDGRKIFTSVADGDVQTVRFLKNHLLGNLYTWMRAVAPAGIDAFFTQLKDMWLERAPNLNGGQNYQSNSSTEIDKLNSKIASLEAQLVQLIQAQPQNNDALEKMYIRAVRLGMPVDAPKDLTSLDNYINDELIRRLGVANTNYTKLSKKYSQMVNVVKKLAKHKCSNCGKAGHNSRKCLRKKKSKSKKGKVNLATLDLGSDSNTNSDKSSDDSSNSSLSSSSEFESEADINKSKSHLTAKSQEVTDIETAPLVSAPFSKKKKRKIDFVQKKDPATDVVTTKCKIKHLIIPVAVVDSGANFAIMTDDISKRSKLEIDTKEKHDLRGIATTPTKSLGIVRNVQ
uniref:CCHC-type domain-containing protein n=1 Tax=Rhizophagus irregularis (strain DAOM 181602 / DAOM 197198 / MUCL 43194) TaxID=747089 RepID=U9SSK4_RHIID